MLDLILHHDPMAFTHYCPSFAVAMHCKIWTADKQIEYPKLWTEQYGLVSENACINHFVHFLTFFFFCAEVTDKSEVFPNYLHSKNYQTPITPENLKPILVFARGKQSKPTVSNGTSTMFLGKLSSSLMNNIINTLLWLSSLSFFCSASVYDTWLYLPTFY